MPAPTATGSTRWRANQANAGCRSCRRWRRCWRHPRGERITTAALAARLDVSEAALYRHFASKAQMFEGLIEFIESTLFSLVNRITTETTDGVAQATQIVAVLLGFAEKNPGMTRVLIGDALVNEDERLQVRMNQLYDRIEASLRQSLQDRAGRRRWPGDPVAEANVLLAFVVGRWMLFAKSGFKRMPQEGWDAQRKYLFSIAWRRNAQSGQPRRRQRSGAFTEPPGQPGANIALFEDRHLRGLHRRRADPAAADTPGSVFLFFHGVQRDTHAVVGIDQAQRLDDEPVDDRAFQKFGVARGEQRRITQHGPWP